MTENEIILRTADCSYPEKHAKSDYTHLYPILIHGFVDRKPANLQYFRGVFNSKGNILFKFNTAEWGIKYILLHL